MKIKVLVGSVFGAAHGVADHVIEQLQQHEFQVERDEAPDATAIAADLPDVLLVITSTTGVGELPDELVPFYNTLREAPPRMAGTRYTVIVLGDSSYETFCAGGLAMDAALEDIGCERIAGPLQIDAMETDEPESVAQAFLESDLLPVLDNPTE